MVEEKALSNKMGINLKGWRHNGRFIGHKIYYKVSERTIVYDEVALCSWIKEQDGKYIHTQQYDMGDIISRWQEDSKIH